ncbi:hypothetical protein QE250_00820 [Chromatiaceae bacterium AAb-1]|jgi:hypothetical protein|nr:hypothetical protein [Chromatiaceae bacterium AAb-1]
MKARSLKLGGILALVLMSSVSFLANAAANSYKMVLIEDVPGVDALQAGKLAAGIQQTLASPVWEADNFSRYTNLCVGYTRLGELENAETACTKAITAAQKYQQTPASQKREMRAYAHTNRGVLRLKNNDNLGALEDFKRAAELNTNTINVHNLQRLELAIRNADIGLELASVSIPE